MSQLSWQRKFAGQFFVRLCVKLDWHS
jgi:hypothetical protein